MSTERAIAELERTRANLLQVVTVAEADYAQARVRVLLGDGYTSAWVPWTTRRAGGDRSWAAPEVGEQVLLACPGGDPANGVVLGAIYQSAHGAPADSADVQCTVYGDGAVVQYARDTHRMLIILPEGGEVRIEAPVEVRVTSPLTKVIGDVHIEAPNEVRITAPLTTVIGNLELTGILSAGTQSPGDNTIAGNIHQIAGNFTTEGEVVSEGDQVAAGISQVGHVHGGVQPGGGNTGVPVP